MDRSNYLYAELLPEHEVLVSNVVAVYDAASKADVADGASWYGRALELAQSISDLTGYTTEQVAGVMAITSSATGWGVNNSIPMRVVHYLNEHQGFDSPRPGWFNGGGSMWRKVLRVLRDNDLSAVAGPKTSAFYANILGDSEPVTVDRHAMRIAMGGGMYESTSIGPFRKIAAGYKDAADSRAIVPSSMQAITWVAWRRVLDIERVYG